LKQLPAQCLLGAGSFVSIGVPHVPTRRHGNTDEVFLCIISRCRCFELATVETKSRAPGTARLAMQHGFRQYRRSDGVRLG
jgi:hypothetical protein